MNKNINKKRFGFTLVELLVVIAIISILTIISLASYTSAQIKARDAGRKSDLDAVSKSLMLYYNDTGSFPNLTSDQLFGNSSVGLTGADGIVYMRETPLDPRNVDKYIYVYKTNGKSFNIYTNLENRNDGKCLKSSGDIGKWMVSGHDFCYGISSPNTVPGTLL